MFVFLVPKSLGNVANFGGFYDNNEVVLIRIYNAGLVSEMYRNVPLISSFKLRGTIMGCTWEAFECQCKDPSCTDRRGETFSFEGDVVM